MNKSVLFISSDYTGHGHKSITDALSEQLTKKPDVVTHIADGFSLAGSKGLMIGKLYGTVTRKSKELWKVFWELSVKKPSLITELTEFSIHENFQKLLEKAKPDVIVVVHPSFNSSVLNILEQHNVKIPVAVMIADLVSINPLWADRRAAVTICPTQESRLKCIEFGVPDTKLKVLGFPVREKFHAGIQDKNPGKKDKLLEFLVMSGGEGVGNMRKIADILLKNFECRVKIVAGRNIALKRRLESYYSVNFPGRIEICGFVENIQDLMHSTDLAFARGSPNVMMEAAACSLPLVITGALPGQEEGNPEFACKYNLGVACNDPRKLKSTVTNLLSDNEHKLEAIKESQKKFIDSGTSENIADLILTVQ